MIYLRDKGGDQDPSSDLNGPHGGDGYDRDYQRNEIGPLRALGVAPCLAGRGEFRFGHQTREGHPPV